MRPEPILVKSLSHIMNKWKKEQNYSFVCEQLKSIRQDLIVSYIERFCLFLQQCLNSCSCDGKIILEITNIP